MSGLALDDYSDPYVGVNPRFDAIQGRWVRGQLSRLDGLRDLFVKRRAWQRRSKYSLFSANRSLREAVERLHIRGVIPLAGLVDVGLSLDASDDEISVYCDVKSRECERIINRHDGRFPGLRVLVLLEAVGIDPVGLFARRDKAGDVLDRNWRGRVTSPMWWRRKVRGICARGAEAVCREAGYVSRYSGAYVSDFGFRRWVSSQRRGRSVIESMELIEAETGEVIPMVAAVDASVSNPKHRRGELMTRARGFEEVAEILGYVPMFFTVTCPSRFHAFSGGVRNPKYSGASPRDASDYLALMWSRCRSRLARCKVSYFGFRVAEPHHDGCPHWHMLLFVDPAHKWDLTEILSGYALEDSGDEPGADKHRFTAVQIEAGSGGSSGATGYIAKYISKNIDGFSVGDDLESGELAADSSLRVRAWASIWGIRQFQQIGGPSVTIWRELRRVAGHADRVRVGSYFQAIIDAADKGDWSGYVVLMGGAVCVRDQRPLQLMYSDKDLKTGCVARGRYGDVLRRVVGVIGGAVDGLVISRFKSWITRRANINIGHAFGSSGIADIYNGFTGPPGGRPLDLCQ